MKQCLGKYCQSRATPSRSCYFIVYSLSTLFCTCDDLYTVVLLFPLTFSQSLTLYILIAKSNNTYTYISPPLTHIPCFLPLVSLAHVFHLILPFLCLSLTSLYSQLSIGAIPANYLQCHSHYFPISATNLLHTFLSPALADPSAHRQFSARLSSVCLEREERMKLKQEGKKKWKEMANDYTSQTLIRIQL